MNESMDRVLGEWLREGPESGPREGLERALAATRRAGQRPGWTLPERWLPMQLSMARTPSLRPLLALVILSLLVVALVAAAVLVGSTTREVPPPFGPARNGAIVYPEGGDLFIADGLAGPARALVVGPEADSYPVFANQGDRMAFARAVDGGFALMSVRPDGTHVEEIARFSGEHLGFGWSPDGSAILVNFTDGGIAGFRFAVVNADGSGSRELDIGVPADYGSWRPDGRHLVFRGHLDDGSAGAFIADADGTNMRQLPIDSVDPVDFEGLGWSPDGRHLSFMSNGSLGGTTGWQLNIADIDADGALTDLHRLKLDAGARHERLPVWSPDSSHFAFMLEKDARRQVGVARADGSEMRVVGPEVAASRLLGYTWSPDGRSLLITELPDNEALREAEREMWSVDMASGVQTRVTTPVATWQRLAP